MNSYIVAVRDKKEDNVYTLLLEKKDLADLLVNINGEEYEVGDIVATYTRKKDSILPFCNVDKNLETGDE